MLLDQTVAGRESGSEFGRKQEPISVPSLNGFAFI
jgi:hypothetical protein